MKLCKTLGFVASVFLAVTWTACSHRPFNPYEQATLEARAHFKKVPIPFKAGTQFVISQGAFGLNSHFDPGHEYTWDFDVPYGTPVLAVEDGRVLSTWESSDGEEGGCDARYSNLAHNLKVRHLDGTVAQYVHIQSRVAIGKTVKKGEQIAVTAKNGFICTPQLDFGIYEDAEHLMGSVHPHSIPLLFEGLPDGGLAPEHYRGTVSAQ